MASADPACQEGCRRFDALYLYCNTHHLDGGAEDQSRTTSRARVRG